MNYSRCWNITAILILAVMTAGCDKDTYEEKWDVQLLKTLPLAELQERCERLNAKTDSHENALARLSDEAKIRYLFCMQDKMKTDHFRKSLKLLRFGSIGSIQDMFPCRDAEFIRKLHSFRHAYFNQRYPNNYFGTEDATNLEFEVYARRVMDEFMHRYKEYDKDGKIALSRLLHDTLTYPGNWKYVPEYMRRELSAYIMNMIPQAGNNATIEPPEEWLGDSELPLLAIEIVAQTGDERFENTFIYVIKSFARGREERNRGFMALRKLGIRGEKTEKFLIDCLKDEEWADSAWYIMDAMAQLDSGQLDKHLLPFIGGSDHRLWAMAAHTYWRLPDFEKRVASLPREKQLQVFLMAEGKLDGTLSARPLTKKIRPEDAQVLVNTFDYNCFHDFVCVARQSMQILHRQKNRETVEAAIELLEKLTRTQKGPRHWLLFGYGVRYLEDVSEQEFWSSDYPHKVTQFSESHPHTQQEAEETMENVRSWWKTNKADFPAQIVRGKSFGK